MSNGWRPPRRMLAAVALGVAAGLGLTACTTPASERGSAPADTEVSFAFGLQRNQSALGNKVWEVSAPTNPDYTQFTSLTDIAETFGASQQAVDTALGTLTKAGFEGGVDPSRGVITGTFSVQEAEAFFGVPFDETTREDDTAYVAPRLDLAVPEALQPEVVEVFGGWATTQPDPAKAKPALGEVLAADPPCPSNERAKQIRAIINQMYGINPYYEAGLTGEGVRVGMLSIEQYSQRALELYENCFDRTLPPVELTPVNAPVERLDAGNVETSLDIAFLGIMAPGIDVVELFQFDKVTSLVFPLADVLDGQRDPAQAVDILTTSVGFCSSTLTADERSMSDWLAMSLAVSGVTFVASSGDGGSSSCYPPGKELSTQYPSESAYVTSVGGTQIEGADSATPSQAVWNEAPSLPMAAGGGPSATTPAPPYQAALSGPKVRQTPDVAFISAPDDVGPIAYCNRGEPCRFQVVAGTSGTTPGFAALVALLLEDLRIYNPEQALGLLNPALYDFAQNPGDGESFVDVTQGNNDLFGVACCTAVSGYDMASGWGSLRLDEFGRRVEAALNRG